MIGANKKFKHLEKGGFIYRVNTQTERPIPFIIASIEKANFLQYGYGKYLISYYRLSPPNLDLLKPEDLLKKAEEVNIEVPRVFLVVPGESSTILTLSGVPMLFGASIEALEDFKHKK